MEILHIGSPEVYDGIRSWLAGLRLRINVYHAATPQQVADAAKHSRAALVTCDFPLRIPVGAEAIRALAANIGAALLAVTSIHTPPELELLDALRPDAYGFREHPRQIKKIAHQLLENRSLRQQLAIRNGDANAETAGPSLQTDAAESFTYCLDNNGCILSASMMSTFATGRVEPIGRSFADLLHKEDISKFVAARETLALTKAESVPTKFRIRHLYGHYLWVDALIGRDGSHAGYYNIKLQYRGTTGQHESHRELLRMNRLYAIVSMIRKVVATVDDKQTLFNEICRIAASDGSFRYAYVGLIEEAPSLQLVAHCGLSEDEVATVRSLPVGEHTTLNQVFQTGGNVVCNDVETQARSEAWKAFAEQVGFRSFIVLPLRQSHALVGMLVLTAPESGFFNDQEISLLNEAAGDISFKLDVLEKERLRLDTEQRLRHNERRLREAQEIAHLGNWEVDFRTGEAIWSEECLRIYGLPVDARKQSYAVWISHIHPEDMDYVMQITAEAGKTRSPSVLYHRIVRTDGTVRYLHSEAHFILDEEGRAAGLHGIAHDITELKEKELRLQESEQRYSALFNDCPQPKWLFDVETHKFVQVNKAAIEKYGYTEEEFYGMTIFDIRPPEDRDRVIEFGRLQVNSKINPPHRQFRHITKSGEVLDVEIYSNAIVLNNKPYRLVVALDITAVSMYEDRMTSAVIQAQENERYEIGAELHDNVCQILAASLMRLAMLNSDKVDFNETCDRVKKKIRMAIKEVRNLSHRLAPASFDESSLADSVALLIDTYNVDGGPKVGLLFQPNVPENEISRELKLHLYRIIQEQLGNIIKHSKATEALVRIENTGSHLKLIIDDNGVGFDATQHTGGIGLSNMKRRVELFRGALDIVSAPRHGCRLTVLIPLSHPRAGAKQHSLLPGARAI
jgi:PAS domain S-box-containing protein